VNEDSPVDPSCLLTWWQRDYLCFVVMYEKWDTLDAGEKEDEADCSVCYSDHSHFRLLHQANISVLGT